MRLTITGRVARMSSRAAAGALAIILVAACVAQRQYTPRTYEPAVREGLKLLQPINVAIFDGRPDKTEDVAPVLQAGMSLAYGTNVNVVPYFAPPKPGAVTIKLRVNQLHAEFGRRIVAVPVLKRTWSSAAAVATDGWSFVAVAASSYSETLDIGFTAEGWWVGTSQVDIEVSDLSKGRHVAFSVPLVAEKAESNTWGYRTATSVSKKAWKATETQMMRILDDVVQKVMSDG